MFKSAGFRPSFARLLHNTPATGDGGTPPEGTQGGTTSPPPPPEPVKITPEMQKLIDDQVSKALQKKLDDAEKARQKAAEEEERKKKAEEGNYKDLYEREKAEREKRETEAATRATEIQKLKLDRTMRDILMEDHPDYIKSIPWIVPTIALESGDDDEAMKKKAKEAITAFVEANPLGKTTSAGTGAEPSPVGRGNEITFSHPALKKAVTINQPVPQQANGNAQPYSTLGWRWR